MTWLTWALSKSFCELPSVAAAGVYGKGTREVSWLIYRSTRPLPRVAREIPSGIDSSRNSPSSVVMTSPTVSSGVTLLPGATPTSIAGRAVLKPPLAAFAGTTPKAIRPVARMLVSARRRETRCGKRGTGAPPFFEARSEVGDRLVVSARWSAWARWAPAWVDHGASARRLEQARGARTHRQSSPAAAQLRSVRTRYDDCARAGVAQLAERQPSKLNVAGSRPVSRSKSPSFDRSSALLLDPLRRVTTEQVQFVRLNN